MKKLKQNKLLIFAISLIAFLGTNLYFSNLIVKRLYLGWNYSNNFINLVYVKNTGAAFSILQNSVDLLVIVAIAAIILMIYYIVKNIKEMHAGELISFAMLFSGIIGNLFERIHFGYVRDFFNFAFMNFPIFNISDVFINIGVFAIIIFVLLKKKPIKLL